jgi:N-acetylmuramoyl-L-alanine amidase
MADYLETPIRIVMTSSSRPETWEMPTEHTVQQGECLASIAKKYGFADWHTIYDDGSNSAFRTKRPDPHVLFPGDRLNIPDKNVKTESCATAMVHVFRLARKQTRLRIIVRGIDRQPLAAKKYKLTVEGEVHEGVLPGDGLLDELIPANALEGELKVWTEDDFPDFVDTWKLNLGHLDPVESLTGVQARLNNLGYDCGPVDGVNGPRTQAAVKAFQKDHGLEVDGIPGPKTQDALKGEHVS